MTGGPTNRSWKDMIQRCTNPRRINYANYGGRGITICDRWRKSFEAFLSDMGPRPDGTTLDRIDNDGNYEPGNCRWASKEEQSSNTRRSRFIEIGGERLTVSQWADRRRINRATLYSRIKAGWTIERALRLGVAA
jgi:hypothetical protein